MIKNKIAVERNEDGASKLKTLIHPGDIVEFVKVVPEKICERAEKLFSRETGVTAGKTNSLDGGMGVSNLIKRSTDYLITPQSSPGWQELDRLLFSILSECLAAYIKEKPWAGNVSLGCSGFQLQRYRVGEGFGWHCDADKEARRRLAVIIFLNEKFIGGETEFPAQELFYKPTVGSMLMFPPYWTHPHRGSDIQSGEKLVATCFMMQVNDQ